MNKRWMVGLIVALSVAAWIFVRNDQSTSSTTHQRATIDTASTTTQLPTNTNIPNAVEPSSTKGRTLIIEVTNTNGSPIGGASVNAQTLSLNQHQKTTGSDGIVEFAGLQEHVPIRIKAHGYDTVVQNQPNFGTLQEALWSISLKPASENGGDVKQTSGWVSVDDKPVKEALLIFESSGVVDSTHTVIRSGPSGRFVVPESMTESTRVHALSKKHGFASIPFRSNQELHLGLPGGGFIEGRVIAEKGFSIQDFGVRSSSRGMPFPDSIHQAMKNRKSKLSSTIRGIMRGVNQSFGKGHPGFSIGPLAPGTYTVYAYAKGMQPDEPQKVALESGDLISGLIFRLGSPLTVTGTVTNKDTGRPISGAKIQVGLWGRRKAGDFGHTKTAQDGRFTLRTKSGERHRIHVSAKGYISFSQGGLMGEAGTNVQRNYQLSRLTKTKKGKQQEYVGVGIKIHQTDDGIKVHSLLDGSPAKGILNKGDTLLMADDIWLDDVTLQEAGETMVGEPGTSVEVLFLRYDPKTQSSNEHRGVIRRERILHTLKRR